MEEAVWGPPQKSENTSQSTFDSNSILSIYHPKEKLNVWVEVKTVLNALFNTLAVLGWLTTTILLWDGFFNNARIISYLLAGS